MPGITKLDEIPIKKKQAVKTKELITTIPKTLALPTPSTPTRYEPLPAAT